MKKQLLFAFGFTCILVMKFSAQQWVKVGYMITGVDTAKGSHMIKGFTADVFCCTNKGLYKSTDNGLSWSDLTYTKPNIANHKIYSVLVAGNGNMFAGTEKKVFKSVDGGASWSLSLTDSATYYDIAEIGGNIVVSYSKGSTNGVYYSGNSGGSWTPATGITSAVRYFLADGATLMLGGTANGVYKSTDSGQSWTVLGTGFPASPGIWGVQKTGSKLFAYSATGNGLYESSDAGNTWAGSSPMVFNGFCQIFSLAQASGIMIASNDGACNPGGASAIRMSNDGGGSWSNFITGLSMPNYFPVLGRNFSGSSFFAKAGNGVDTYRSDLTTGIPSLTNTGNLLSVFPNPATSEITVKLYEQNGNEARMSMYNLLSERILEMEILQESTRIDLSPFKKGVYFVRVNSGDRSFIKKIVLQ